jgi:L-cystine uptake protein TcyP (sodium:dicarboxylate symporter family)
MSCRSGCWANSSKKFSSTSLGAQCARRVFWPGICDFHHPTVPGAAVAQIVGVLFLARLYGVSIAPAQVAQIVVAVVFASFAVPGVPGGSIIAMVPVLAAARLPVEGIGILLAVDTIPDMFRTTANVTGAMTLAAVLPPLPAHTPTSDA